MACDDRVFGTRTAELASNQTDVANPHRKRFEFSFLVKSGEVAPGGWMPQTRDRQMWMEFSLVAREAGFSALIFQRFIEAHTGPFAFR